MTSAEADKDSTIVKWSPAGLKFDSHLATLTDGFSRSWCIFTHITRFNEVLICELVNQILFLLDKTIIRGAVMRTMRAIILPLFSSHFYIKTKQPFLVVSLVTQSYQTMSLETESCIFQCLIVHCIARC